MSGDSPLTCWGQSPDMFDYLYAKILLFFIKKNNERKKYVYLYRF